MLTYRYRHDWHGTVRIIQTVHLAGLFWMKTGRLSHPNINTDESKCKKNKMKNSSLSYLYLINYTIHRFFGIQELYSFS